MNSSQMGYDMTAYMNTAARRRNNQKYSQLELLLGETDEAYQEYIKCDGHMNGDFAEFATQYINLFQRALHNPTLTTDDLAWALRKCDRLKGAAEQAGVPWTILAAACLAGKNNLNGANDQ